MMFFNRMHYERTLIVIKNMNYFSMIFLFTSLFGVSQLFAEKNSDFPAEITGHIMNACFEGRTECKIRKTLIESDRLIF